MSPTDPNYSAPTRVVSPARPVYVDLREQDPFRPAARIRVVNLPRPLPKSLFASLRFLMETEVHVYSFAVSVNILISFYPFIVAMILVCLHMFHWPAAANVIIQTVKDYFPSDFGIDMGGYLQRSSGKSFSFLLVFLLFLYGKRHFHTAGSCFQPHLGREAKSQLYLESDHLPRLDFHLRRTCTRLCLFRHPQHAILQIGFWRQRVFLNCAERCAPHHRASRHDCNDLSHLLAAAQRQDTCGALVAISSIVVANSDPDFRVRQYPPLALAAPTSLLG